MESWRRAGERILGDVGARQKECKYVTDFELFCNTHNLSGSDRFVVYAGFLSSERKQAASTVLTTIQVVLKYASHSERPELLNYGHLEEGGERTRFRHNISLLVRGLKRRRGLEGLKNVKPLYPLTVLTSVLFAIPKRYNQTYASLNEGTVLNSTL